MQHEEILNKVHEALEAKELNFKAKMAETFAFVDGVYVPTGKFTPVREDRKGKESIIAGASFSKHYVPIQNEDAFSVLGEMADVANIDFVNVGSWGNGAGIYAQISLGDVIDVGSTGDRVGKYVSLVNSHDGSRSLQLLVTPYRFFCQNQISKALGEARRNNRLVSIHHDIRGEGRLREVAAALTFANKVYEESAVAYKQLADRVITMDEAREAIYRCMIKQDEGLKEKKFESRATQFIERFNDADGGKLEKLTGWNLYNAIQGAYQHGTKKTATYEKSLIMGRIAQQAEDSLKVVTDLLFDGGYSKTSTPEFDQLFAKVA